MTAADAPSSGIGKPSFASRYLKNEAAFASRKIVAVSMIAIIERIGNFSAIVIPCNRISKGETKRAAEAQKDQRNTNHHAFDATEAGDDARAANSDAESDEDSFGQDHAHAPAWGMVLAEASAPVINQSNGSGGAWARIRGRLAQNWRFLSHVRNIAETRQKGQQCLRMEGDAVNSVCVGRQIRSRLREKGTLVSPFSQGSLKILAKTQRPIVSMEAIKQSLIVGLFAISGAIGAAAQEQTPKQGAQDAAGIASDLMETTIKDSVNLEEIVPGFETADPSELTNHYEDKGVGLEQATQDALNDFDDRAGEAGSMIVDTYSTRPEQSVTRTEEFLSSARGALSTPEALTDGIFSVNQAPNCEPTQVNAVAPGIRSCDVYSNVEELKCAIGQIVEVDAEKSYRCERETATYLRTCPETLQVQCLEPVQNCRLETGLLTTAFADLQLQDVNGLHRLAISGIDGFNGGAADITRRARLVITDISKVTSFRLSAVHYRTFLNLRLNGSPIYSGPGGDGTTPFVYGEYLFDEFGDGSPSNIFGVGQNGVFLTRGVEIPPTTEVVGIDLLDQLVEGENIIEFDLIVTSTENGRAEIDFTILLSCCANWQAEWVRQCE